MSSTATRYEHILLDDAGTAFISGTTMKVVELVLEREAYGWSAEELHFQHPYLTLGQIHSALAYYRDHKDDLDREIGARRERAEQLRQRNPRSPGGTAAGRVAQRQDAAPCDFPDRVGRHVERRRDEFET
ncbi:MAG: DUF433 domain-containing protein [Planctomycetaceae bacterium]